MGWCNLDRYDSIANALELCLSCIKPSACLFYAANTVPADALVTLGGRALAGMVFLPKARIFHLQHKKS